MLKPVRCFTCGSLVGEKYDIFKERFKAGVDPGEVLDSMGVKRFCCRRMLLSNIDIIDKTLPYFQFLAERRAEFESDTL
jgi:DNA-directed RNA polymerase subunit N